MYGMEKWYTVTVVRERLAEALDEAEKGLPVIIERRGVRFRLSVEDSKPKARRRAAPKITVLDPSVLDGQWTWEPSADGLAFKAGRKADG